MPNGAGAGAGQGRGFGRRGQPPVACICPKCGYEAPKTRGMPCREMKCPTCDLPLVGK